LGLHHNNFSSGDSRYFHPLFFHPSHPSQDSLLVFAAKSKVHSHQALDLCLEYAPTNGFAGLMVVVPGAAVVGWEEVALVAVLAGGLGGGCTGGGVGSLGGGCTGGRVGSLGEGCSGGEEL
jgi:hypothetical protein